jgi:hypothetical protein
LHQVQTKSGWFEQPSISEAVVDRLQNAQTGLGLANKILRIAKTPQRICKFKNNP